MGCPKRLIKIEPNMLSLRRLLHLKTFMHTHTHTHAYFVINRGRIVLGNVQRSRQGYRQKPIKVRRRRGHGLPRIVVSYSQVLRDGHKERLGSRPIGRHPLPSPGQTESAAAKQPSIL